MSSTHNLVLLGRSESGDEEWECPTCRRRLMVRWEPDFSREVLERGDDSATHVGATGGPAIGGTAMPVPQPTAGPEDLRWLAENGIAWGRAA